MGPEVNEAGLRRSILRVTAGDAVGTGFVVGPGLVLTCHHVVDGATGCALAVGPRLIPVDKVTSPPSRAGGPVSDLALLHADLPAIPPVELDPTAPEPDDRLFTFGFTDQYPEGDSALFTFEGPAVKDEQTLFRLKNSQARPGLSGAPLLNTRTGRVVGVVSRTRGRESDLGARAVSMETAFRYLPELAATAPDGSGVTDAERAHLARLIAIHERNIRFLETQIAAYGLMDAPMYKQAALEDERAELARLRSMLDG
ncbi:S1 family peptidase [Actinoplanes philippinensis]|uniref:S1 family peptidase n=1 Tax=Actinoplanes philippinensis TaxID=35752 RepID=UPI003409C705